MAYTRAKDYQLYCDTVTLTQVVNADLSLKRLCEYSVEDQIKSYLSQRYDFNKPYGEFTDTDTWSYTTTYGGNDRVYLDATAYSASSTYALNTLVLQSGNVYKCTTAITVGEAFTVGKWALLGEQYDLFYVTLPYNMWDFQKDYLAGDLIWYRDKTYTCAIPNVNTAPDSTYGSQYWGTGTTYSVLAGTSPTDTTKWTAGDNRNNYLLQIYITIVVYNMFMKVAPKNIQQTRKDQYEMAIDWLEKAGKGLVSADITLLVPEQGSSIRWGSVTKNNNIY
jgi:hypothetical protein